MIQARFGLSLFAELFSCLKIEPKLNCWNCRNLFVIILYLYNFHNLIITLVTAKNDRFHVGQSKTKYNFLYLYLFVIRCVSKLDEICLARCSFDLNFKQKTNQVLETKISSMHNVCGHGHGKDSIMARRVLVRSCVQLVALNPINIERMY